jgi:uncharacterized MnhB-related membrane protein
MNWKKRRGSEMDLLSLVHVILPLLIVVAAGFTVWLRDLVASTIALAAMSLLLSLEFYILHAPDVAIAEAGVGACITTAIIILAISMTKREEDER